MSELKDTGLRKGRSMVNEGLILPPPTRIIDTSGGMFMFNAGLLRDARLANRLSQKQLAELIRKTSGAVCQYEAGGGQKTAGLPRLETFRLLCLLLNVSPLDLLYLEEQLL